MPQFFLAVVVTYYGGRLLLQCISYGRFIVINPLGQRPAPKNCSCLALRFPYVASQIRFFAFLYNLDKPNPTLTLTLTLWGTSEEICTPLSNLRLPSD